MELRPGMKCSSGLGRDGGATGGLLPSLWSRSQGTWAHGSACSVALGKSPLSGLSFSFCAVGATVLVPAHV